MKEKGLTLPYEVTIGLLIGETNLVTSDILKRLKAAKVVTLKMVEEIDNTSKDLKDNDIVDFLVDVVETLKEKGSKCATLIIKYCLKLIKYDMDYDNKVQTYRALIAGYSWSEKYDDVVYIAESMEVEIDRVKDKTTKVSCYANIANAYYKQEKYDECLYYLKKLKLLGKDNEFFYLTLECNVLVKKGQFEKAEKAYFKILNKAIEKSDNDYTVDGYSNISALYDDMKLKNKAKEYVNKAIDNIRVSTSKIFIFNTYYNAYMIYTNYFNDEVEKIEEFFSKAFPLAIELNYNERITKLLERAFNIYFDKGEYTKIKDMLGQIEEVNIKSKMLLKLMKI